ncbi:MAG: thiamine pyrophosphate-dependent enzyme [Hyphomicrobiales bacterium]
MKDDNLIWYKVLDDVNDLAENRVITVFAGTTEICLTHFKGKISALTNKCPHQGGPLGEGSIEKGYLRCPWHGWDFHPCTGNSPGSHDDGLESYPVEINGKEVFVGITPIPPHEDTVSDVMVQTMINWGITSVFGMVGHSNLGFADAMRRASEKDQMKFYGIRHEGAASFAASAYAKLTGRPAACFAIAGPGSTNMFTGLWDAKVDRAPVLALTGQVATQVVGTGNFQEIDLCKAFQTVADFNHYVQSNSQHAELMSLAIKHSLFKKDVAHLTFPDEVQVQKADGISPQTPDQRVCEPKVLPSPSALNRAIELLKGKKRPVIIVGHGAKFNMPAIIELAERLNCPVLTTFKGKGLISDSHPLAGGVLGRSGTPIASYLMNESDCLLVIGASFSNHTGITPKKPTIQIDIDPLALAKFHKVDVPVWGEISLTINELMQYIHLIGETEDQRIEIAERWEIWRMEKNKRMKEYHNQGLSSIMVFNALNRLAPENAVMTVDVGNNAYSFGRYYESKNNTFLMSGYLGSIGFALPAAMGAYAAVKHTRPIIAVAGDGGFCQYLAEVTTLVKYDMPVKIILLNNNELGKISKEQRFSRFPVWKTHLVNPDFSEYANSCGALGIKVTKPEQLGEAMQKVFAHEGPALLEIHTDAKLL